MSSADSRLDDTIQKGDTLQRKQDALKPAKEVIQAVNEQGIYTRVNDQVALARIKSMLGAKKAPPISALV